MSVDTSALFQPLQLGGLTLRHRITVAPMTRVSASEDGLATAQMADYYESFAEGGFALITTEGIYPDAAWSQGYLHQPGLATNAQRDAWRPVVERVHAHGAAIVAQLMHAGALSQGNPHRPGTRGPSRVRPKGQQMAFYRGEGDYPVPEPMTTEEIDEAILGHVEAAHRAVEAGFDGIELHGANGYLLDQFLTEGVNVRDDPYGGDAVQRLRLIVDTVHAVRNAVGNAVTLSLRISQGKVNDFQHEWRGEEEAAAIFNALGLLPLDYLHTTEFEAWQPAFGDAPSLAALARRHSGLPVMANGSLHDPARAAGMLASGSADFVSLGRGALTHADWPRRVQAGEPVEAFDRDLLTPIADLDNAERHRQAVASEA